MKKWKFPPKMMRVILAAFLSGLALAFIWSSAQKSALCSNRWALEGSLREGLEHYHDQHGLYPQSLGQVDVAWLKDEERRKVLLQSFYYENRGSTFLLWWPKN